jgi:hypothetical protein
MLSHLWSIERDDRPAMLTLYLIGCRAAAHLKGRRGGRSHGPSEVGLALDSRFGPPTATGDSTLAWAVRALVTWSSGARQGVKPFTEVRRVSE